MEIIKIWNDSPSRSQVEAAADAIRRGELVIIPTDSVYAIVCDALNQKAIAELCRIKGINPEKNNLSIICSDIS
ncbi:MAG: Sua5/YciO/YrdC/YwlC family protein, partial [Muribaculaceae bacterium]|nr:Sua5/YciO/YrdC/YwlC family protein [Muribaculaceae bacterium]